MNKTTELEKYFNYRFSNPQKYRGHHFFQHNRYTLNMIKFILVFLSKNQNLLIPPGDYKDYKKNGKYEKKMGKYSNYSSLCSEFKVEFNKRGGQFNTLKKNIFPDMEKMGLVEITKELDARIINITHDGLELISEHNIINLQMKWARAITKNIRKSSVTFVESLIKLLEIVSYITEDELVYFASFLDFDGEYGYKDIAKLIEYSRLQKAEYGRLKMIFKEKSKVSLESKDKKKNMKFDYTNFSNSTRSLWIYLQDMIYFQVINFEGSLRLQMRSSIVVDDKSISFKRDPRIKTEYLKKHKLILSDEDFFDFHHIIPLFYAGTVEEKIELDKWENIICINQNTHARFTRKYKNNILLNLENNIFSLNDIYNIEKKIEFVRDVNSKYDSNVLELYSLPYNTKMLKQLNYMD